MKLFVNKEGEMNCSLHIFVFKEERENDTTSVE